MRVIVMLDKENGMLFGGKRQSRDRKVIDDMQSFLGENVLVMKPFSHDLYQEVKVHIKVTESLWDKENRSYTILVEDEDITPYLPLIEEIVIYHWNRTYPGDFFFTAPLEEYKKIEEVSFPGFSHDKITRTLYREERVL